LGPSNYKTIIKRLIADIREVGGWGEGGSTHPISP
jgi:hypothetical protein